MGFVHGWSPRIAVVLAVTGTFGACGSTDDSVLRSGGDAGLTDATGGAAGQRGASGSGGQEAAGGASQVGGGPSSDAGGPTRCESDRECTPQGQLCDRSSGECVDCVSDTDCDADGRCSAGVCESFVSCRNSLDCAGAADGKTVCNTGTGGCVECVAAADCGASNDCIANVCVPFVACANSLNCASGQVCDATAGRCVECVIDADCSGSSDCGGDVCAANVCRPCCASDNDCTPQGLLCDRAAGHCAECVGQTDCATGQTCVAGTCQAACVPTTCAAQGAECGSIPDGCSAQLSCGSCVAPESCNANNVCACASSVVCTTGDCGPIADGCGGTIDCGSCTAPDVCGGGGASRCGPNPPQPTTCVAEGKDCGTIPDGIGGTLDCGVCITPESCGGGGTSNECGCTLSACGGRCGTVDDGCGGTQDCGTCPSCTPTQGGVEVCDSLDNDCDTFTDESNVCRPGCVTDTYQGVAYMFCSTLRTWLEAEQDCQAGGMHLVRIEEAAENTWVNSTRVSNGLGVIWLGGSDRAAEGDWRWIGGSQFWSGGTAVDGGAAVGGSYQDWETVAPQPDNTSGVENCATLPELNGTGWNDVLCTSQHAYVCERYTANVGCYDVVQNGTETGVDCGGSCVACDTCSDGVQNGDETDIDCGGSCGECAGTSCFLDAECASGDCAIGGGSCNILVYCCT